MGQVVGEVGFDWLCLLRESLVFKIPEQVSVQALPRLKAGAEWAGSLLTQNPFLQAGKHHPLVSVPLLLSFWGCFGSVPGARASAQLNPQSPS